MLRTEMNPIDPKETSVNDDPNASQSSLAQKKSPLKVNIKKTESVSKKIILSKDKKFTSVETDQIQYLQ